MSEEQLAQWLSIIASVFIVFGYFSVSDVRAKLIIMVGCAFFMVHFFMLGAMTAMIMNLVNIFRVGLSIKFHKSMALYGAFIVAYLIAGLVTYEVWIDILPLIASLLGCTGMFLLSGIKFRLFMVVGSACWIAHNIYVMSIGGITTEMFVLTAHLTTIYRLHKGKEANVQKI